ncbi:MAG: MASE1 domain-containing protein, partial [Bdellovibrionota bacterium]
MLQRLKLDRSDLPKMALLFVIYVLTAELGLNLGAVSGFATLVWPPTGLALAALFLFGRRLWPAVFLAALAVNYGKGAPLPVACGIALGNTLEALLGAALFRREAGSRTAALERVREVFALVALASILSTLVSATTGVASLYFGGVISSD